MVEGGRFGLIHVVYPLPPVSSGGWGVSIRFDSCCLPTPPCIMEWWGRSIRSDSCCLPTPPCIMGWWGRLIHVVYPLPPLYHGVVEGGRFDSCCLPTPPVSSGGWGVSIRFDSCCLPTPPLYRGGGGLIHVVYPLPPCIMGCWWGGGRFVLIHVQYYNQTHYIILHLCSC